MKKSQNSRNQGRIRIRTFDLRIRITDCWDWISMPKNCQESLSLITTAPTKTNFGSVLKCFQNQTKSKTNTYTQVYKHILRRTFAPTELKFFCDQYLVSKKLVGLMVVAW